MREVAAGKVPQCGAIFMCNRATIEECFERRLLGLPRSAADFVKSVKAGMTLFLFEYERRKLYGVFEATTNGDLNIIPHAYASSGRKFPAQVKFSVIWCCHPLKEDEFRGAISENYFDMYKFKFGLSKDQIARLLWLFHFKKVSVSRTPSVKRCKKRMQKQSSRGYSMERKSTRSKVSSSKLSEGTNSKSAVVAIKEGPSRYNQDSSLYHHEVIQERMQKQSSTGYSKERKSTRSKVSSSKLSEVTNSKSAVAAINEGPSCYNQDSSLYPHEVIQDLSLYKHQYCSSFGDLDESYILPERTPSVKRSKKRMQKQSFTGYSKERKSTCSKVSSSKLSEGTNPKSAVAAINEGPSRYNQDSSLYPHEVIQDLSLYKHQYCSSFGDLDESYILPESGPSHYPGYPGFLNLAASCNPFSGYKSGCISKLGLRSDSVRVQEETQNLHPVIATDNLGDSIPLSPLEYSEAKKDECVIATDNPGDFILLSSPEYLEAEKDECIFPCNICVTDGEFPLSLVEVCKDRLFSDGHVPVIPIPTCENSSSSLDEIPYSKINGFLSASLPLSDAGGYHLKDGFSGSKKEKIEDLSSDVTGKRKSVFSCLSFNSDEVRDFKRECKRMHKTRKKHKRGKHKRKVKKLKEKKHDISLTEIMEEYANGRELSKPNLRNCHNKLDSDPSGFSHLTKIDHETISSHRFDEYLGTMQQNVLCKRVKRENGPVIWDFASDEAKLSKMESFQYPYSQSEGIVKNCINQTAVEETSCSKPFKVRLKSIICGSLSNLQVSSEERITVEENGGTQSGAEHSMTGDNDALNNVLQLELLFSYIDDSSRK